MTECISNVDEIMGDIYLEEREPTIQELKVAFLNIQCLILSWLIYQ